MARSKLRNFVLNLLSDGKTHFRPDIENAIHNNFGADQYTQKQITDLLNNLKRIKKIAGNTKKGYIIIMDKLTYDDNNDLQTNIEFLATNNNGDLNTANKLTMHERLEALAYLCKALKNDMDAPKLLERLDNKDNLNHLKQIYDTLDTLLDFLQLSGID